MSVSKTDFIKKPFKDKTLSVEKQREKIYDLIARDFVITEPELNKVWRIRHYKRRNQLI